MDIITIKEAQKYLNDNVRKGVKCPCCDQLVKLYKVSLLSSQVTSLIKLYKLSEKQDDYFHRDVITPNVNCGSFAKLAHWGLIKSEINTQTKKRCSGIWAITNKGRLFVEEKIKIPKYKYLFNQKVYDYEDEPEMILITDLFRVYFHYQQLMKG